MTLRWAAPMVQHFTGQTHSLGANARAMPLTICRSAPVRAAAILPPAPSRDEVGSVTIISRNHVFPLISDLRPVVGRLTMRCSVSQAWICDRSRQQLHQLVAAATISAAARPSLLAYSAAAASTARAWRVSRPPRQDQPLRGHRPTAAVLRLEHCPSGGGARTLSSSASPNSLAGRSRYLLDN